MRAVALLALLVAGTASAQDFERIAPRTVAPVAPRDTAIRLKVLKGIVFLPALQGVRKEGPGDVTGMDVGRVPELQTEAFRARMAKYLGASVSLASIDSLVNDVIAHYAQIDRPFVVVTAPAQDITGGVLQVVVIEGKVGAVRIEGARVFDERIYRGAIGLQPGDPIPRRRLDADIDFLNRNPFRDVRFFFEPGQAPGTTDVILRTQERPPLRVYAGVDDTGSELTDSRRVLLGLNWGNAFGLDHQLNYQLTASPDLKAFRAHSATYIVPLPSRQFLTVFGSYADVEGRVPTPFALQGNSRQAGLRYEVPLQGSGAWKHSLLGGIDYKRTNNNLEFGGANVSASTAAILQGVGTYQASMRDDSGSTSLTASVFYSPGRLSANNEDANFQALRAFAQSKYAYGNLQFQRVTPLPRDFAWHFVAEGQVADGNLLGSEQLGAGGFSSVRGYDERQANGDEGLLIRNELRTPSYKLGTMLALQDAQLQLLAFIDQGSVRNKKLLPGEARRTELSSVGIGSRFSVGQYVSARLDYGWQLKAAPASSGRRDRRAHFSLVVSY